MFFYKSPENIYLKSLDCLTCDGVTNGNYTQVPRIELDTQYEN